MSKRSNNGRDDAPEASRRNFLKGATIAGAAALSTPVAADTAVSGFPEERPKAAPPEEQPAGRRVKSRHARQNVTPPRVTLLRRMMSRLW